jgi:sugar phosphate isomerase/epimerase
MLPGHNTNGFPHHRLGDAVRILADLGFQSVAITLDHHALDPSAPDLVRQVVEMAALLSRMRLRCVIETGARFLLDPWRKHQPTLLDPDPAARAVRLRFLEDAVRIGADLGADAISFWSGTPVNTLEPEKVLVERLAEACRELADYASDRSQRLAFEPEPGMLIDTMDRFANLFAKVQHPAFGLTIDLGHLHCLGELPMAPHLQRWRDRIWNIHIEGMRRGTHEHLQLDEGDMDVAEALGGLKSAGYTGGVHLELSRHGHDAVNAARKGLHLLREAIQALSIK